MLTESPVSAPARGTGSQDSLLRADGALSLLVPAKVTQRHEREHRTRTSTHIFGRSHHNSPSSIPIWLPPHPIYPWHDVRGNSREQLGLENGQPLRRSTKYSVWWFTQGGRLLDSQVVSANSHAHAPPRPPLPRALFQSYNDLLVERIVYIYGSLTYCMLICYSEA